MWSAAASFPEKRAIPDKAHVQSYLQHRHLSHSSEARVITLRNRPRLGVANIANCSLDGRRLIFVIPNDIHLNIGHDQSRTCKFLVEFVVKEDTTMKEKLVWYEEAAPGREWSRNVFLVRDCVE
jgi:hypothetical protein